MGTVLTRSLSQFGFERELSLDTGPESEYKLVIVNVHEPGR